MGNSGSQMDWQELWQEHPTAIVAAAIVVVAVVLLVLGGRQTFYTIEPEEVGIVLRFGKYDRETGPGLHFKAPFGIERVYKVPVQRQLKQEFGFRTITTDINTKYQKSGYEGESLMLTGDLNSADVEWVVQYRISDPLKYLFEVREVEDTFRGMAEAIMREIVGDRSVDEVITWGKEDINLEAQVKLQELCDQYSTGLTVQSVLLQNVNAPPPVQPSWNEVNEAEQEKDKLKNQAKSQYNSEVPKAKGQAERMILEAEGYSIERVNEAGGHASKFSQVYEQYRLAPLVTRRRIYIETMTRVLPKAGRKIVLDKNQEGVLQFLDLTGNGVQK